MKILTLPIMHLAWRNLWRNRRRTLLTISGIAFSCFLFVFATPVQFGAFNSMLDLSLRLFTGSAQIQKQGYNENPLLSSAIEHPNRIADKIRNSDQFGAVSTRAMTFALVSSSQRSYGAQILGVDPNNEPKVSTIPSMIRSGSFLSGKNSNQIVIGSVLARNLKIKVGDELTILGSGMQGGMAATILPVTGIFESGDVSLDRYMVEMPLGRFQELFNMGDSVNSIVVSASKTQNREQVASALRDMLKDHPDITVLDWTELLPGIKETWDLKKVGGLIFMLILTVVVVFSIFNTFLMAILERTKEFGLMLALGTRPNRIRYMVMLESLILSLLGIAAGLVIALPLDIYLSIKGFMYPGIGDILKQYNLTIDAIYPQINMFNLLLGPGIIFISTNLAAWIPLRRIQRLRPVEAMRTI